MPESAPDGALDGRIRPGEDRRIRNGRHDREGRCIATRTGTSTSSWTAHLHWWDGSPENQKNKYGAGFISCFYDYHSGLSPEEYVWPREKYEKYDQETMVSDLFVDGYVDVGILQSTYLSDFYVNGFNTTERNAVMKDKHPDRFILNSAWDPRDEEAGLADFEEKVEKYGIKGVKLYTAAWRGDSRGWSLKEPVGGEVPREVRRAGREEHPRPQGARRSGRSTRTASTSPTSTTPRPTSPTSTSSSSTWACRASRTSAGSRVQEPNVYGGLAVLMPFIHPRPKYFADVMAELLFWLGEDRLLFSSDYALWHPKWLVEKFVDFELPEQVSSETGVSLTVEAKEKILGLNACKLYDIDPVEHGSRLRAGRVRPEGRDRPGPARRGRARRGGHGRDAHPRRGARGARRGDGPRARPLAGRARFRPVAGGGRAARCRAAVRLPTYWCSPNFAYLMVGDAHEALRGLPGATACRSSWWTTARGSGSRRPSPPGSPSRRPSPPRPTASSASCAAASA